MNKISFSHKTFLFYSILSFLFTFSTPNPISTSILQCQKRCLDGNIAFPLARDETTWSSNFLQSCDYGCRVKACVTGCGDIEGLVSTCAARCSLENGSDSCRQGCHAVEQTFFSQLQDLMNKALITSSPALPIDFSIQPELIPVKLSFPDEQMKIVKEISTFEVEWYVQSRKLDGNPGWRWAQLPQKSFQNASIPSVVGVAGESSEKVVMRGAVSWRGRVVVSPIIEVIIPQEKIIPKLELENTLQIASDKYSACWKSNRAKAKFRLKLFKLDDSLVETIDSSFNCHLWRSLPRENCCRVTIADITDNPELPILEITLKIELAEVPEPIFPDPSLLITNGTHIERLENLNDYVLKRSPILVPFDLGDEDQITAIAGIAEDLLVVGTEHGGIWIVPSPPIPYKKEKEEMGEDGEIEEMIEGIGGNGTETTTPEVGGVKLYSVSFESLKCFLQNGP